MLPIHRTWPADPGETPGSPKDNTGPCDARLGPSDDRCGKSAVPLADVRFLIDASRVDYHLL